VPGAQASPRRPACAAQPPLPPQVIPSTANQHPSTKHTPTDRHSGPKKRPLTPRPRGSRPARPSAAPAPSPPPLPTAAAPRSWPPAPAGWPREAPREQRPPQLPDVAACPHVRPNGPETAGVRGAFCPTCASHCAASCSPPCPSCWSSRPASRFSASPISCSTCNATPAAAAADIESRWVSQPLAFAGELRPPRLNHQPHLHRRTAVTAAFSLEDVAACAAAACPPRRLLPPPPPPCAPALPCDGSPNNTAAASNARSSSCTAPSCRFCFSCAAFLRAPLALPSSSSSSSSLLDSSSSLAASSTPPRVAVRVASEIQRSSVAMSSSFLPACAREIASSLRCSARMAAVALTVPFSRSPSSSSSSSSSPPSSSSSSSSLSSSSSSSSSSSACKSRVSRSAVSTSAR
jgi:hypothetical protein